MRALGVLILANLLSCGQELTAVEPTEQVKMEKKAVYVGELNEQHVEKLSKQLSKDLNKEIQVDEHYSWREKGEWWHLLFYTRLEIEEFEPLIEHEEAPEPFDLKKQRLGFKDPLLSWEIERFNFNLDDEYPAPYVIVDERGKALSKSAEIAEDLLLLRKGASPKRIHLHSRRDIPGFVRVDLVGLSLLGREPQQWLVCNLLPTEAKQAGMPVQVMRKKGRLYLQRPDVLKLDGSKEVLGEISWTGDAVSFQPQFVNYSPRLVKGSLEQVLKSKLPKKKIDGGAWPVAEEKNLVALAGTMIADDWLKLFLRQELGAQWLAYNGTWSEADGDTRAFELGSSFHGYDQYFYVSNDPKLFFYAGSELQYVHFKAKRNTFAHDQHNFFLGEPLQDEFYKLLVMLGQLGATEAPRLNYHRSCGTLIRCNHFSKDRTPVLREFFSFQGIRPGARLIYEKGKSMQLRLLEAQLPARLEMTPRAYTSDDEGARRRRQSAEVLLKNLRPFLDHCEKLPQKQLPLQCLTRVVVAIGQRNLRPLRPQLINLLKRFPDDKELNALKEKLLAEGVEEKDLRREVYGTEEERASEMFQAIQTALVQLELVGQGNKLLKIALDETKENDFRGWALRQLQQGHPQLFDRAEQVLTNQK